MFLRVVDTVRAAFAAWNAGDMDALRDLYAPDVVVRTPEGWPEQGPFVGRDAVMREWEHVREAFDADVLEPTSNFIVAGGRVLVRYSWHGAGHGPGDLEMTMVVTVRNEQIPYQELFFDEAQALEAVGLSE